MTPFNWKFYTYSPPAWDSMLTECKKAKKSIDIEHYIFDADNIGKQFVEVFKEKSKEGVKVRLLLDMVGSFNFYNSSVPNELRKFGIEVKFFNVISPWRILNFTSWFFRDHRKLVIVDNLVAFTGGLGIRDNMTHWRDTTLRLEGDVVEEMTNSLEEMWKRADDHGFVHKMRKFRNQIKRRSFITNDPYFRKRFLYRLFIEALRSSRKSIYITVPYFIPDGKLSRVLLSAKRRGVDVRILIPEKMDVPVLETASNSTLDKFLRHGIKIYKYQAEFIHAKTATVDSDWGTVGSFNLDNLSFIYNHEANIITFDTKCVGEINNQFFTDLQKAVEVNHDSWKKRPLDKKIREFFVRPIRGFL